MTKFTFRLPDRLKLIISKEEEQNILSFSAKESCSFILDKEMVHDLLSSRYTSGDISLLPPLEHSVTSSKYFIEIIHHEIDGVTISLAKHNSKRIRRLHSVTLRDRDFKKFMKVCREVYINERSC